MHETTVNIVKKNTETIAEYRKETHNYLSALMEMKGDLKIVRAETEFLRSVTNSLALRISKIEEKKYKHRKGKK